jgi:hypothetical protein
MAISVHQLQQILPNAGRKAGVFVCARHGALRVCATRLVVVAKWVTWR